MNHYKQIYFKVTAIVVAMSLFLLMADNVTGTVLNNQTNIQQRYEIIPVPTETIVTPQENTNYIVQFKNESLRKKYKKKFNKSVKDEALMEDNSLVVELTASEVKTLKTDENVDFIEEDSVLQANSYSDYFQSTTEQTIPWNISIVGNSEDTTITNTGNNVKLAIIDSGVELHGDLYIVKTVDFSAHDDTYTPPDNSGHGTMVAGIINAQINGVGIRGVAPNAKCYSVKVLDKNNQAPVSSIVKAIEWCIKEKIQVINMSFGMAESSKILEKAIKKAYKHNIVLVASAGNGGSDCVEYPATYPEVISVGSTDREAIVSEFSANNDTVDMFAPGENVQTTGLFGGYVVGSGTSLAAPHIAASATVLLGIDSKKSNDFIKELLLVSAKSFDDTKQSELSFADLGSALEMYNNFVKNNNKGIRKKFANAKKIPKYVKTEDYTKDNGYVTGSWRTDDHYNALNGMPLSSFHKEGVSINGNATKEYDAQVHRWLVADTAYRVDYWGYLANSDSYDWHGNKCYNPYHADPIYDVDEIDSEIRPFLYNLAKKQFSGTNISLTCTAYSGDFYGDYYIGLKLKRRIIDDINQYLIDFEKEKPAFNVRETEHKGWIIYGILAHLLQDQYAHRAKVLPVMVTGCGDDSVDGYLAKDSKFGILHFSKARFGDFIKAVNGNPYPTYSKWDGTKRSLKGVPTWKIRDFLLVPNDSNRFYDDKKGFYGIRFSAAQAVVECTLSDVIANKEYVCWYVPDVPLV